MTLTPGNPPVVISPSAHQAPAGILGSSASNPSRLSMRRYLSLTAAALAVTGAQLLLLPRWLSAKQFGTVVLGISATQGVLQLGDLGFSRLYLDACKSPHERAQIRADGISLTLLTTAAVAIVAALAWAFLSAPQPVCLAILLGALSAAAVSAARFRAASLEVVGDEERAAVQNFLWTNAPKIGLVAAVLVFRSPTAILTAGAVAGVVLCRPSAARLRHGFAAARRSRQWAFPFISIAAGFVLTWSDTYFLGANLGLEAAGAYEAVYRVLGVCSYGFLPWVSVITSRVSMRAPDAFALPMAAALGTTLLAAGGAAMLLVEAGTRLFPRLDVPLEAIPPLLVFYVAATVAACSGSALHVRGRLDAVTVASVASAVTCVAGHAAFTVRGGAATAAWVTASAMAVNAWLQAGAYHREVRRVTLGPEARR